MKKAKKKDRTTSKRNMNSKPKKIKVNGKNKIKKSLKKWFMKHYHIQLIIFLSIWCLLNDACCRGLFFSKHRLRAGLSYCYFSSLILVWKYLEVFNVSDRLMNVDSSSSFCSPILIIKALSIHFPQNFYSPQYFQYVGKAIFFYLTFVFNQNTS